MANRSGFTGKVWWGPKIGNVLSVVEKMYVLEQLLGLSACLARSTFVQAHILLENRHMDSPKLKYPILQCEACSQNELMKWKKWEIGRPMTVQLTEIGISWTKIGVRQYAQVKGALKETHRASSWIKKRWSRVVWISNGSKITRTCKIIVVKPTITATLTFGSFNELI